MKRRPLSCHSRWTGRTGNQWDWPQHDTWRVATETWVWNNEEAWPLTRAIACQGLAMLLKIRCFILALIVFGPAAAQEDQAIRIGLLRFGTVAWEIDTIRHHGLDRK